MKKPVGIETAALGNDIVLPVGLKDVDGVALQRILHQSGGSVSTRAEWTLIACATLPSAFSVLRKIIVPIVICDCDLMPGAWRVMLEHISALPDPPLMIVTSRLADERLWAEALNLGAYDMLVKPFDAREVIRILSLARQHWRNRHRVCGSRTTHRDAAAGA
jgi:DNA-binding response OmpR family regulator